MSGTDVRDKRRRAHRRSRCLYRRLGVRYVYLVVSAGPLAVLLVTPAVVAFFDFVWVGASVGDWARTVAFAAPWMALVAVVAELLTARSALPLIDWAWQAEPGTDARAALRAAKTRLPRALRLCTAIVVLGAFVPTYLAAAQAGNAEIGLIAAAFLSLAAFTVVAATSLYYVSRPMLAPVMADVIAELRSPRAPNRARPLDELEAMRLRRAKCAERFTTQSAR
jgi:hypothetical protein